MSGLANVFGSGGGGMGTVTSITFNGGLASTPNPVTTIGTATIDQTNLTVLDGTVYWDTGTQLLHTTPTGTAGQILTSNGAASAPSYQSAPGGGAFNLIQTKSGSGVTELDFTTGISGTFNNYQVIATEVSVLNTTTLQIQISTDGGATYISAGYTNGTTGANLLSSNGNTDATVSGTGTIYNMTSNVGRIYFFSTGAGYSLSGGGFAYAAGQDDSIPGPLAVNALRVVVSDGSAFSGTISLYSLAN